MASVKNCVYCIEGSTALARAHPAEWEVARQHHHAMLRAACEAHHGPVFQIISDAFCVAFHHASDLLYAAHTAQQALVLDPLHAQKLYAGTLGGGVLRRATTAQAGLPIVSV